MLTSGPFLPLTKRSQSCLWCAIVWGLLWVPFDCGLWRAIDNTIGGGAGPFFVKLLVCSVFSGAWIYLGVLSVIELRRRSLAAKVPPAPSRPLHPLGL